MEPLVNVAVIAVITNGATIGDTTVNVIIHVSHLSKGGYF